jgi:hypothetical protein
VLPEQWPRRQKLLIGAASVVVWLLWLLNSPDTWMLFGPFVLALAAIALEGQTKDPRTMFCEGGVHVKGRLRPRGGLAGYSWSLGLTEGWNLRIYQAGGRQDVWVVRIPEAYGAEVHGILAPRLPMLASPQSHGSAQAAHR